MTTLYGDGKWFFTILNGVYKKFPREEIVYPKILVAYDFPDEVVRPEDVTKGFRVFESPKKLFRYMQRIEPSSRHFFEYIFGERKRPPFLDIDLKVDEDKVITKDNIDSHARFLRQDILTILWELGIPFENLRWYTSHRQDKRSYHLVIKGYYLENCKHSKKLIKYIHQKIHKIYHKAVDIAVSKSLQAFRILGSCKKGDERPKIIEREWDYYGVKYFVEPKDEYEEFLESLCCRVDEDAIPFPEFDLDDDVIERVERNTVNVSDLLDQELFEQINEDIIKVIGDNFNDPVLKDNMIAYNRLYPSYCPICTANSDYDDVHERGGMFAVIVPVDLGYNVYLHCFQSERHISDRTKRSLFIGFYSTAPNYWIGKPEHMNLEPLPIRKEEETVHTPLVTIEYKEQEERSKRQVRRNVQHLDDKAPLIVRKADPVKDKKLIERNKKILGNRARPKKFSFLDNMSEISD